MNDTSCQTVKLCVHRSKCEYDHPEWDEYIPICPECPRFNDSSHTSVKEEDE